MGLAVLNDVVVPFAREYREFCFPGHQKVNTGEECRCYYSSLGSNSLRFGTGSLFALNRELERNNRELDSLIREPGLSDVEFLTSAHARIIVGRLSAYFACYPPETTKIRRER
jgi:hypothetical protein